ncbi:MAG: GGDEF domain-containing protein, partial [Bacillota bacterium]|nr:GGDEF domain-containing protein [Bacillota bacterium]
LTLFTGWFFYFNIHNEYVRGPYFFHTQLICLGFYLYSVYLPVKNRNLISRRYLMAMIKFLIPAIVGISLQMMFYGLSLIFSSTSISILIIYLSIQNRDLERDYLTGLYNRMELDKFLSRKFKDSSKLWGALMIDIDDFKNINDNYGHITGDRAIIKASEIIKNCFHADDFISRFGGDEFVVIVDIKDEEDLYKITERLQGKFDNYNRRKESPYELSVSIGGSLYDRDKFKNSDEFIHFIDSIMYKNKRKNQISPV